MVSSYTANLAAFLTIENPTSPINSVKDLADNVDDVQYGAKRTGSTRNFFLVINLTLCLSLSLTSIIPERPLRNQST